jgi:hypothetical protein
LLIVHWTTNNAIVYQIVLVDQTGEPTGSRNVVANTVRLTPTTEPRS